MKRDARFPTLTKEQVFGVLHDDELWRRITPIPGSVEVLQKLYDEGHQLYMVTASSYHTCKTKVERLLELFHLPGLGAHHFCLQQANGAW